MRDIELAMDALQGEDAPTALFGSVLPKDEAVVARSNLSELAEQARRGVKETFGVHIEPDANGMVKLDQVIKQMWQEGWTPEGGDPNLFVSDFGVLLADALLAIDGTAPVFRSSCNLNHFSVWLTKRGIEYFPFHKTLKCLSRSEGESLAQLYRDARR